MQYSSKNNIIRPTSDVRTEDLNGYEPWFDQIGEKGVLCWVSKFNSIEKNDIQLVVQVHLEHIYRPTFITAGFQIINTSYARAIPLTKEELQYYIGVSDNIDFSTVSTVIKSKPLFE